MAACPCNRRRNYMTLSPETPTPQTRDEKRAKGSKNSELVKRILSGIALSVTALGLTLYSPASFLVLILVGTAVMAWEWRNMVSRGTASGASLTALGIHSVATLGAVTLTYLGQGLSGLGLVGLGALLLLAVPANSDRLHAFIGPIYTGLPAMALVWLRSDADYGVVAVLFVLLLVWMADIGAYAAGRTFGGPKLAPRISPNKTWSGALGGLLGSALVALAVGAYLDGIAVLPIVIVAIILAIASQIGDLYESSVKRRFGIKDSSNLIPGHGGILDRVDGLIAAAVVAGTIALFFNSVHPGHAILVW